MNKNRILVTMASLGIAMANIGCGSSESSVSAISSGSGTFPSFYALTTAAMPTVTSSTSLQIVTSRSSVKNGLVHSYATAPLTGTYNTNSNDFTTAFSNGQNFLGQVLYDAGDSGPVKSIFVLLAQADDTFTELNTHFSDENGNPKNCTAIAATTNVTTPFFATAALTPFNNWSDAGKYTCYTSTESGSVLAWGRHAITSPSAGCTDAFEYYVVSGYGKQGEANTEQVSDRGTTVDRSSVSRYYYNGCTQDVKIFYAQSTQYSAGVEFSSRSEINANTSTNAFTTRVSFIDRSAAAGPFQHNTFTGTGVGKKPSGSSTAAHFIMGYKAQNCAGATNGTCTDSAEKSFCVKNDGSGSSFALETTTSNCSNYLSAYTALNAFELEDLSRGYVAVSTSAMGL